MTPNNAASGQNVKARKRSPLDDTRVRVIVSLLLAVVCWLVITLLVQPDTSKTIYSVPVSFTYDSTRYTTLGLSVVNDPSYTVTLSVGGDGSVIGDLTKDDFVVYPNYSSVKGAGGATLRLLVKCTADVADKVKVSIQPSGSTVDVVFDTVEEKTVPVRVVTKDLSVASGYTLYKATSNPSEITLTGPTGELQNVTEAVAEVTAQGELNDTVTVNAKLTYLDAQGNPVKFTYVTADSDSAEVTLTVYKLAELPLTVSFINTPDSFDASILKYSLSQDTLQVAGPADVVDSLKEISIGSIDLSTFALDKVYDMPVKMPSGLVSQENVTSVTVSFDVTGLGTKTLNLPADHVQVINLPSTYQLTVTSTRIMNVTLCGPQSVLEGLTADAVVARIDADELSIVTGQQNIAVQIYAPSSGQVFAIGTYTVVCQIESN